MTSRTKFSLIAIGIAILVLLFFLSRLFLGNSARLQTTFPKQVQPLSGFHFGPVPTPISGTNKAVLSCRQPSSLATRK